MLTEVDLICFKCVYDDSNPAESFNIPGAWTCFSQIDEMVRRFGVGTENGTDQLGHLKKDLTVNEKILIVISVSANAPHLLACN